jgi:3' exoribonuclease, RNase T-like
VILFIDTEWADQLANELVSMALVSDCGKFEFYAERDPLPDATEFVRMTIYPLLDRGKHALPDAAFTQQLHEFFRTTQQAARPNKVTIAYDHRNDLDLLGIALEAFNLPDTPPRPAFDTLEIGSLSAAFSQKVEDCFAKDPALSSRRHHALIDARVNREAYLLLQR